MRVVDRGVAPVRALDDAAFDQAGWLQEEVDQLAVRFAGLDEVPFASLLVLAELTEGGPADAHNLARTTQLTVLEVEACLDALAVHGFVSERGAGRYRATGAGREAVTAIATNITVLNRVQAGV
jgi:hypothetical protein